MRIKYSSRFRTVYHPDRTIWGPGIFGAVAPFHCEYCGPVWRLMPGCGYLCPICESRWTEDYGELAPMKVVRRYHTKRA